MSLQRLLIIRHAEEHDTTGVTDAGNPDPQSLTVRGWQRAGALVRFFGGSDNHHPLRPDAVYASSVGPGSESRRPQQTVAPLIEHLGYNGSSRYNAAFAKPDTDALMTDVLTRSGTVLLAWEHSQIVKCVSALPNAPETPDKWPSERYDLLWICDRTHTGWTFEVAPQFLLGGDAPV